MMFKLFVMALLCSVGDAISISNIPSPKDIWDTSLLKSASQLTRSMNQLTLEVSNHSMMQLTPASSPDHVYYRPLNSKYNKTRTFTWDNSITSEYSDTHLVNSTGLFSKDAVWYQKALSRSNVTVTRVSMTYVSGCLSANFQDMVLQSNVSKQLMAIHYNLNKSTVISRGNAMMLVNQFLEKYGSLFLTDVYVGNESSIDYALNRTTLQNYTLDEVEAMAKVAFNNEVFGLFEPLPLVWQMALLNTNNHTWSHGINSTYHQWTQQVVNNTNGIVSYNWTETTQLINKTFLPLTTMELTDLHRVFTDAVNNYVNNNVRFGCTDPNSDHYQMSANQYSPWTCNTSANKFYWGGAFQTGYGNFTTPNPFDGQLNCTTGYNHTVVLADTNVSFSWNTTSCYPCGHNNAGICCSYGFNYGPNTTHNTFDVQTCDSFNTTSTMLFGGVYTRWQPNELTGNMTCPTGYNSTKFNLNYDGQLYYVVCHRKANTHWIDEYPYGGFYSTTNYSSFNTTWCPDSFTRHAVFVPGYSQYLYYCTKAPTDTLVDYHSPTFNMENMTTTKMEGYNVDNVTALMVDTGSNMTYWQQYEQLFSTKTNHADDSSGWSATQIIKATVSAVLCVVLLVIVIYYIKKWSNRRYKTYTEI